MKEIKLFGEWFNRWVKFKQIYNVDIIEFKTNQENSDIIKHLFDKYTDIDINNSKQFYSEKQLDKVYFYINIKNKWLEPFIIDYLKDIDFKGEIDW